MKDEHKEIIIKCINKFGTHDHPAPDSVPIEGFTDSYIISCLCEGLIWEKENFKKKFTHHLITGK